MSRKSRPWCASSPPRAPPCERCAHPRNEHPRRYRGELRRRWQNRFRVASTPWSSVHTSMLNDREITTPDIRLGAPTQDGCAPAQFTKCGIAFVQVEQLGGGE